MEQAPDVGDDAVRFRETVPMGPENPGERNEQFTVVRAGNTIVTFQKLNVDGGASFPTARAVEAREGAREGRELAERTRAQTGERCCPGRLGRRDHFSHMKVIKTLRALRRR